MRLRPAAWSPARPARSRRPGSSAQTCLGRVACVVCWECNGSCFVGLGVQLIMVCVFGSAMDHDCVRWIMLCVFGSATDHDLYVLECDGS